MTHWSETAERVTAGDPRILGEDDRGDWWVPERTPGLGWYAYWNRRFCWWKPSHWPFYFRSRVTGRVAFLGQM